MPTTTKKLPQVKNRLLDMFDFDRFWEDRALMDGMQYARIPATNIHETKDSFVLEMAAPGLEKKDFHVDIRDNVLEIKVEKEKDEKEDKKNYWRREYGYFSFDRCFTLPKTVVPGKIKAEYVEGVLRLVLPKTPEAKKQAAKEIKVV